MRLAGGQSQNEGRVEVCFNGEWGIVAIDYWSSTRGAEVICRQLGYDVEGIYCKLNEVHAEIIIIGEL